MKGKIKVVELFAGVGGFRLGFERASKDVFQTIWANQWEPGKSHQTQYAFQCYTQNYFGKDFFEKSLDSNHISNKESTVVCADINKVKKDVPNHDLLVGGFPCQDYSVATTGAKGIEGKKGVLWWSIRDIIESKKPKFVLLENVDRLIKSPAKQRGRDFGVILKCLNELGYVVEWRVINAAEYGHPQRRRRTFIFAANKTTSYAKKLSGLSHVDVIKSKGFFINQFDIEKSDLSIRETYDLGSFGNLKAVSDKFEASFKNSGFMDSKGVVETIKVLPVLSKQKPLHEIITETKLVVPDKLFINGSLEKWNYLKGAKKINRKSKSGHEYSYAEGGMAFPDNLNLPSRTMLTSEATLNRSTHVVMDPKTNKLRLLTPEECEALNEFPRGWTDCGMPLRWRYFMMGNALVVGVIEKLGKTLLKIVESE
ncbi:MAG: DNA (cytosine-5-)-methyltransferase [archaeon]|jgi:DNA (cytosine-5)-methyltransferase 1